jgi:Concanavalin A-like lectin/glucanases superfamily
VRLYGSTGGSGLDAYLDLTITRGTIPSPSFDSCTGFTADTTDWLGLGGGVIYAGTLAGFGDDWTSGTVDAMPSVPEAWTTGESHAYKLTLSVQDNNGAQGKSMSQTFTWEARNIASYSQVVLSDGPAAYWRLDETSGSTAADATATNNGTYTNGPTLNQPTGVRSAGTAVDFDGSNDFVFAPDSASLSPTSAVTLEAWIRPDQFGAMRTIVHKTNSYWLRLESSGALSFFVYEGSSYEPRVTGPTLVAGTLYHVVGTFDGANVRVYVDGTLRATTARAVAIQDNTQQVNVGVGGSYFDGVMDEVAVYGKALTAQQISEHYAAGHG